MYSIERKKPNYKKQNVFNKEPTTYYIVIVLSKKNKKKMRHNLITITTIYSGIIL